MSRGLFSDSVLCGCGCGLPAPIAAQTDTNAGWVKGQTRPFRQGHNHRNQRTDGSYLAVYRPDHPRAKHGCVHVHVLVAEKALGRLLPSGVHVHHVDDDKQNNKNTNLVICQDAAYHKLLHYRARIVRAGGNPNTEKFCSDCQTCKPLDAFNRAAIHKSSGRSSICRECSKIRFSEWTAKQRAVA